MLLDDFDLPDDTAAPAPLPDLDLDLGDFEPDVTEPSDAVPPPAASSGAMTSLAELAAGFVLGGPAFEEPGVAPKPTAAGKGAAPAEIAAVREALATALPTDKDAKERALVERKNAIEVRAADLAKAVTDEKSCQLAVDYANFVDETLRAAQAHFDPLVAEARAPYQRRLDERKAVLEPLEKAKEALTGKTGAVTRWIAAEKRRREEAAAAEQKQRDEEAAAERRRLAAEQQAREDEARKARLEAERQRQERERLEREAREAAAAGDRQKAAEAERLAREADARVAEERARAEDASRAAQEAEQRKEDVVSEVVQVEAPKLSGAGGRARWTWECTLPEPLAVRAFAVGVAKPQVLEDFLELLRKIDGWQQVPAEQIVKLLEFEVAESPELPPQALQFNAQYLTQRARADTNTLKWPGVRFFDAGSTALAGKRGRQ